MEEAAHPKSDDVFGRALTVELDIFKVYVALCLRIRAEEIHRKISADLLFEFGVHKVLIEVNQPLGQFVDIYKYSLTSEIGILTGDKQEIFTPKLAVKVTAKSGSDDCEWQTDRAHACAAFDSEFVFRRGFHLVDQFK